MTLRNLAYSGAVVLLAACGILAPGAERRALKAESLNTAQLLVQTLFKLQIKDASNADFGAIRRPSCGVLHTRAAEAVCPFTVIAKHSGDEQCRRAAVALGGWLIRQQLPDGNWKETPEEWAGTTTDQLLMMVLAFPQLRSVMPEMQIRRWKTPFGKLRIT